MVTDVAKDHSNFIVTKKLSRGALICRCCGPMTKPAHKASQPKDLHLLVTVTEISFQEWQFFSINQAWSQSF